MIRRFSLALLAVALVGVGRYSDAATLVFTTTLSGPNESPPNLSPGFGFAEVDYNVDTHSMHITASFTGLLGTTTMSHIHSATAVAGAGTAGVATQTPNFALFPLGVTSGTFDQTLDMLNSASYNPAFVTANGGSVAASETAFLNGMLAGKNYYNIHTTVVPGGEIRGFLLLATPEPTSLVMLGTGILGVIVYGRRKAARARA